MKAKTYTLLFLLLLVNAGASGQEKPKLIGEIEFFGYSDIDLEKVKAALPFHEKEPFSMEIFAAKFEQAGESIQRVTGRLPTDIGSVCCDERGDWLIFIGLSGSKLQNHARPHGRAQLPKEILSLYDRFIKVNMESVQRGVFAEDYSQGYALSVDPLLRSIELDMRTFALAHEKLLRLVLLTSHDDKQRIAAAELMGYARQSGSQIEALVSASRDSSGGVRNNATRALIVLARSSAKIAQQIPVTSFIDQLLSGTWTDLNKAGNLLDCITSSRNVKDLAQYRRNEVLARLIEMAKWRAGYGEPARYILGRLAGIEESRLKQLVSSGHVDEILNKLRSTVPSLEALKDHSQYELSNRVRQISITAKGHVGVAAMLLESGNSISLNPHDHFPMQSVYKLPIAMAVLSEVDAGKLNLAQRVQVKKADFVGPGQHSPLRDEHPNGVEISLKEVLQLAVSESDGTASDVLLRLIGGAQAAGKFLNEIKVAEMVIANTEKEIGRDWETQYRNWASPQGALALLRALHEGRGLSHDSRNLLLKMMTDSPTGLKRIKGLLPPGTIVAHKTGTSGTANGVTAATNDIGIVTLPDGSHAAIVIFVSDSPMDETTREGVIAKIARTIWDEWSINY